jgi:hypothetical protein
MSLTISANLPKCQISHLEAWLFDCCIDICIQNKGISQEIIQKIHNTWINIVYQRIAWKPSAFNRIRMSSFYWVSMFIKLNRILSEQCVKLNHNTESKYSSIFYPHCFSIFFLSIIWFRMRFKWLMAVFYCTRRHLVLVKNVMKWTK